MCKTCKHEETVKEIRRILDETCDLPERAADFAESIGEKLESIWSWIEENSHVTEKQKGAVENMGKAVGKWFRD